MESTKIVLGFTCFSRMGYGEKFLSNFEFKDQIKFGFFSENGIYDTVMAMEWYCLGYFGNHLTPNLNVYSDSMHLLTSKEILSVFPALLNLQKFDFSPDEFSKLLIDQGYTDFSIYKLPEVPPTAE